MGAALKLAATGGVTMRDLPALAHADEWEAASASQRALAELHFAVVRDCIEPRSVGALAMARNLLARIQAGVAPAEALHAAALLPRGLSEANVRRLIEKARKGGLKALLPGARGKRRVARDWDVRARVLWNHPAKRTYAAIAMQLCDEGFAGVTAVQVARYLESLPAHVGSQNAIQRIGPHLYKQTREKYQKRHLDDVLVGEIYAGDGHTVDCYVAHPNTGGLFRPELTVFIDVKTRYVAGWYFSESETKESTLYALGHALRKHNHVPGWLYLDHGAGYRAQMLSDTDTGFFKKFGIATTAAIPGNPRGKGWIESFFHTVRDRHDKFFFDGWTYCGDDMAKETNRRLHVEIKNGKRKLPSAAEYKASFAAWLERYHATPHSSLDGRTPGEAWAGLQAVPLHMDMDAVMRPRALRKVRQRTVELDKRRYFHEVLIAYDGRHVHVEYDLENDAKVWVRDETGRLICEAPLDSVVGVLPISRLEEQRDVRLKATLKRKQLHIDEALRRREDPITHESQLKALEDMGGMDLNVIDVVPTPVSELIPLARTPRPKPPRSVAPAADDDEIRIDLTDWSCEE